MKIFKNNLHYIICIIVAAIIIFTFVLISNKVFVYETSDNIEISQSKTNERHSVYPWYIFENGDTISVDLPIDELASLLLLDYAFIKDSGECRYSEPEKTYFSKDVIITDGDADIKVDIAFRISESTEITYMHLHTPQTATEAELEDALNKYREILKDEFTWSNLFIDFYETWIEIYETTGMQYKIPETYAYIFLMNRDNLRSYIADGLVWFAGYNGNRSFVVAIDPSFEDAIILFAMK